MSSKTKSGWPEHNPFIKGFGHDRTIFLQIILAIVLLAISGIAGFSALIGDRRMGIYKFMIPIGMFFIVIVQTIYYIFVRKKETKQLIHKKKAIQRISDIFIEKNAIAWILIVINLVIMFLAGGMMLARGYELYQVVDEYFISVWEQLTFSVIVMSLAVQFFRTGWLSELFSRRAVSFICSLVLADLIFALCHWWAYGGDFRIIALIAASGLVFVGVGYRWPSIGVSLHFGYNVLIILTR